MKPMFYAVATVAALLPAASFAVTATPELDNIIDGGTTTLSSGSLHSFRYTETEQSGGAQEFTYEFEANGDLGALAGITVNAVPQDGVTGLFIRWLSTLGGTPDAEWDGSSSTFSTAFADGDTKYLTIGWDSTEFGGDVNVNIQAVPVPAGFLLLGTALVGFGALRKRG